MTGTRWVPFFCPFFFALSFLPFLFCPFYKGSDSVAGHGISAGFLVDPKPSAPYLKQQEAYHR
jgi:hypothetical protein